MADKRPIALYSGQPQELTDGDRLVVNGPLGTVDYIDFDVTATVSGKVGRLRYNNVDGTLEFTMAGGNVTQQIGQELPIPVKHADSTGLTNGSAVYQAGSNGDNILVRYAQANAEATSSKVLGVLTESASGGSPAFCTTFGIIRELDTSFLTEGAAVWLSPTVAGGLTTTKPTAPNHLVFIGLCIRSHATEGKLFVNPQNGYELDELHDVKITNKQNNDTLVYDSAQGVWINRAINSADVGLGNVDNKSSATIRSEITSNNVTAALGFTPGDVTTTGTQTLTNKTISSPVIDSGTANGVTYLNGSKVLTSGSALTFDGTKFGVTGGGTVASFGALGTTTYDNLIIQSFAGNTTLGTQSTSPLSFLINNTEQMRLTSTGLGIGTSLPGTRLEVSNGSGSSPNLSGTSGNFAITQPGLLTSLQMGGYGSSPFALWIQGQNKSGNAFPVAINPEGGNVGIGTSSPSTRLHVVGSGNPTITLAGSDGAYSSIFSMVAAGVGSSVINANGGQNTLLLQTNSVTKATLDSSGNLGLGVTPSAWFSTFKVLDVGASGAAGSSSASQFIATSNAYLNASVAWIYKNTDAAAYYNQSSGVHSWATAPSGTAGNAISFTQAMTLDASGNLNAIGAITQNGNQVLHAGNYNNYALPLSGGSASGLTLNNGYTEEVFAVTGTTPALSPTNGSIQTWTLSANSSPTIGTWVDGQSITLMIDDGTDRTITWPTISWTTTTASPPVLRTTGYTTVVLWEVGSVIYGKY